MIRLLLLIILSTSFCLAIGQNKRALFGHFEYQTLKYDYLTIGLGYQPQNTLLKFARKHKDLSFIGWTVNYSKALSSSDWGISAQTIMYSSSLSGPFGIGLEGNYKVINESNHIGFKPLIGLSFPFTSIMYACNFDFYEIKTERIRQHEIIVGIRFPIINKK